MKIKNYYKLTVLTWLLSLSACAPSLKKALEGPKDKQTISANNDLSELDRLTRLAKNDTIAYDPLHELSVLSNGWKTSWSLQEVTLPVSQINKATHLQVQQYLENLKKDNSERYKLIEWEAATYLQNLPDSVKRNIFIIDPSLRSLFPHYNDFTNICSTWKATCQDRTRSCYNYSGALMYEHLIKEKGFDFMIDRDYLNYVVYKNQLERIISELQHDGRMKSIFVDDGSSPSFYRALTVWWVIPQWIRTSKVSIQWWFSRDMTVYLQKKTETFKKNKILTAQQKIEYLQELIKELKEYHGNPPEKFTWKWKQYTPQLFAEHIGVKADNMVSIINKPDLTFNAAQTNNRFSREDSQTKDTINRNISYQDLQKLMRTSIEQWTPFEVALDTGEPWISARFTDHLWEAYSIIPNNRPVGYEFNYETPELKTQFESKIKTLCNKAYYQMTVEEKSQLRALRIAIWDITPNHVITIVGSYTNKEWQRFYLAYDSGLWASYTAQMRILSEQFLLANNTGANMKRNIVEKKLWIKISTKF
jgi:hypothetical protein